MATGHPHVTYLRPTGQGGLDDSRACLRTGGTSGYAAVNLAVHLGAVRIVLLGYDMSADGAQHHFFGDYPDRSHPGYAGRLRYWPPLHELLQTRGVELINASRRTALPGVPRVSFDELFQPAPTP
jgi:hypothetical protein